MKKSITGKVLDRAQANAKQTAGIFCRLFLSEPKVPQALLEEEVRGK